MSVPEKYVSLAACLGKLSISFYYCGPQPAGGRVTCGSTGAPLPGKDNPEPWDTWQPQSSPLRKAEPWAVGRVVALSSPQ
jgi:hypothetical protein